MSQKEEESKEAGKEKNEDEAEEEEEEEEVPGSTLFIKNLNFSTTEEKLQEVGHFRRVAVLGESEFFSRLTRFFSHLFRRRSLNVEMSDRAPLPRKKTNQVLNKRDVNELSCAILTLLRHTHDFA